MVTITLAAAIYTQIRLRSLTASRNQAWVGRMVLAGVGLGFGWTTLARIGDAMSPTMQTLIFLSAFGLVHVPAAIILLLKIWQRSNPPVR